MSRSKKIVLIFGVLLGVCGSFYFYIDHLRKEINAVVEPMVNRMAASNWDPKLVEAYSTDSFKQWQNENNEKHESMLKSLKALGPIKNYQGIQQFFYKKKSGTEMEGAVVLIDFAQTSILMSLEFLKVKDTWLIQSMGLDTVKAE